MAAELQAKLTLDNREFMRGLEQADMQADKTNQGMNNQKTGASGAAAAVKGLGAAYLALKAAQVGFTMGKAALFKAGALESETARLEVLLGSMEEAERLMGRVMAKAGSTPLETRELQEATRTLIALGSETDNVLDELTMMGDISQGVGMQIGELANIYGKMRSKGVIQAEELNQLAERGIPIIAEFAKQLGVSEAEVRERASQGKITFENLQTGFANMTGEGGKFNGMMERMSTTWEGKLSTLKDNFNQIVMIKMGEWVKGWAEPMVDKLNDALELKRQIDRINSGEAAVEQDEHETGRLTKKYGTPNSLEELEEAKVKLQATLDLKIDDFKKDFPGATGRVRDSKGELLPDVVKRISALDQIKTIQEMLRKLNEESEQSINDRLNKEKAAIEEKARIESQNARDKANSAIRLDELEREREGKLDAAVENRDASTVQDELNEVASALKAMEALRESTDKELFKDLPKNISEARDEMERLEGVVKQIAELKRQDEREARDAARRERDDMDKAMRDAQKKHEDEKAEAEAALRSGTLEVGNISAMQRQGLSLSEQTPVAYIRREIDELRDIAKTLKNMDRNIENLEPEPTRWR
jgi:tape measure domain-containing protein